MSMVMAYAAVGLAGGLAAGFFGLGGGVVLIPLLVWFFGMGQHQAQGVSLAALLLPVGLLGAMVYWKADPFPLWKPLCIALGLFVGAYFGGLLAHVVSERTLRVAFGCLTVLVGLKLISGR